MKNLGSFLTEYVSSKNNINNENNNDKVINDKVNEEKTPDIKQIQGKEPDTYGDCDVDWAIDEPVDNEASEGVDKKELSKNMKRLLMKFKAKEDFFILGEAGWGKTTIIKQTAKKFKRSIVTVYLDKAEKEDLGGIPVPVKGKNGDVVQDKAMPTWAKVMMENPDKQFLLFFDEMNQADPGIQNALMPIVLEHVICGHKFKNFIVGAAGNYESENDAVSEMSVPLKSRFKPIIVWETGGDSWRDAFKYLHKNWDEKLSKELLDKFEENAEIFNNPRELEHKVLKFLYELKQDGDYDAFDAEDYLDRLEGLVKDDLTRTQEKGVKELADDIFGFMNHKGDKEEKKSTGRSSRKDMNMVDENIKTAIKHGMKFGYIEQDGIKYGISEENISAIVDQEECNAEMLERIINKFKNDGIEFKFKKNEEWKKKGYKDPEAD